MTVPTETELLDCWYLQMPYNILFFNIADSCIFSWDSARQTNIYLFFYFPRTWDLHIYRQNGESFLFPLPRKSKMIQDHHGLYCKSTILGIVVIKGSNQLII